MASNRAILSISGALLALHVLCVKASLEDNRLPEPTLTRRRDECPEFEGSEAFYGLGIRIGIYLQWFSTWLTNSLNPMGAAANHEANSILLLAILTAVAVVASQDNIQPVEVYIMLLLGSGFAFTVLSSSMGIRLYFLQPSSLARFLHGMETSVVSSWRTIKSYFLWQK
jgi:hypothetical protein